MDYEADVEVKPDMKVEQWVKLENADSSEGKLVPILSNISKVLKPVADVQVLPIAIVGPNASDKTTIYNGILNSLQNIESGEEEFDSDIPSNGKVNILSEFENSCSQPGIYCTNQTFQVGLGKNENKKCIAILPLYVQPSSELDWNTDNSLIASLIGLSLLISSTTIFNIHKRLNERTLTAISNYLKYAAQNLPTARISQAKKKNSNPFHKAVFVLRDWNFPSEFAYGLSGGLKFVQQQKLKSNDVHTRRSWQNRQIINGLYQEIFGCLLPFSGQNFGEETDSYNPEFFKHLKQLIGNILDFQVENVPNLLTGKSLMSLIESHTKYPIDSTVTQINSMHVIRQFGIQVQFSAGAIKEYVEDALQVYENFWSKCEKDKTYFDEKTLKDNHLKAKKKAGDFYKQAIFPEIEDDLDDDYDEEDSPLSEFYETGKKLLLEALANQFILKKQQNAAKKMTYFETLNANLLQQYKNLMKNNVTGNNSADIFAKRQSKECIASIRGEYLENIGADGDIDGIMEDEEHNMNKLMSLLAEEENRILSRIGHEQTNKNDSTAR